MTGLHILGRLVPGWMLVSSGARVPSGSLRAVALLSALGLAVACIAWVLASTNGWLNPQDDDLRPSGVRAPADQG